MGLHTHGSVDLSEAPAGALHSLGPPLPSRGPLQPLGYPPLSSLLLTLGLHPLGYPHPSGDPGLPSGLGPLGPPLHSGAPFCPPGLLLSSGPASPSRLNPSPSGVPLCPLVFSFSRNPILCANIFTLLWVKFYPSFGVSFIPMDLFSFQGPLLSSRDPLLPRGPTPLSRLSPPPSMDSPTPTWVIPVIQGPL